MVTAPMLSDAEAEVRCAGGVEDQHLLGAYDGG
jgi:hypothetical protein